MTSLSHKRVSRFQRNPTSKIQIQERDIEILQALYSYRLLSTTQIAVLFFSTKKRAEKRLRQLFDAELIDRVFRPVVVGAAEILYILDKAGVSLLAQHLGTDRGEINTERLKAKSLKPFFLDHVIEVNQFRVAVTLATPQHDSKLLFWKYEHELQNKNQQGVLISDRVTDPKNPAEKIPVTPDGFFGLETPRGRTYFFVEVDRGTMDNPRFLRKMRGYARYFLDGVYEEKWGYKAFRVLTTTTKRRVENLIKTTGQLSEKQLLAMFHFTERENMTPERILQEIWQVPLEEGVRSIV